ncbi:hypothetical protein CI109_103420 [Kwoniella shandongensis]|uniref:Uncharacterized protein n=1 Tax=Kwoniella shandongensis TaxID=1734106 RepID=A0A5M6BWF2_9TREE|nr:uncharacterized protein CI109_004501 [Kwoniella shandongensis]KAA5527208.1 hypothetical protein CI109_004501 [Kwoniella shandongensis]
MTIRISIPISCSNEAGPSTTFATTSSDPAEDLRSVVSSLRTAKRVVAVSGAGVSTSADIPDFRSASGLFNDSSPGKGKGKERTSGYSTKDLFHVKCLSNHTLLASHHALITSLASLAFSARPTAFHSYLSTLDDQDRLLRCYTQNIDNLEEKAGLSIGIPPLIKRASRSPKKSGTNSDVFNVTQIQTSSSSADLGSTLTSISPEGYRVIPLHGLLADLHCPLCSTVAPLLDHLPLPPTQVPCPTCQLSHTIRSALSERTRRTGYLRPSVVLYGEEHPQGEQIGSQVQKDLKSVDMLLVAGTSLSIPGVKRIVKEMAKAARSRKVKGKGRSKGEILCRTVFVNDEAPSKGSEWEGVFDYWVQGDVQLFISDYLENSEYETTTTSTTTTTTSVSGTPRTPTKKRKVTEEPIFPPTPESLEKNRSGSATEEGDPVTPTKKRKTTTPRKRKTDIPLTPLSLSKSNSKRVKMDGPAMSPDSPNPVRRLDFEGSLTPVPFSDREEEIS